MLDVLTASVFLYVSLPQTEKLDRLVLAPLTSLQSMFASPQKLIQKRYDKLLDYCSRLETRSSSSSSTSSPSSSSSPSPSDESCQAGRDYQALNAQLVEELQRFNKAACSILINSILFLVALLQQLMEIAMQKCPSIHQLPVSTQQIHKPMKLFHSNLMRKIHFTVKTPKFEEKNEELFPHQFNT